MYTNSNHTSRFINNTEIVIIVAINQTDPSTDFPLLASDPA